MTFKYFFEEEIIGNKKLPHTFSCTFEMIVKLIA